MNTSVKRVQKNKLQQTVEDNLVAGWKLQSQNENVAIMTKPGGWGSTGSHILVFLFTAWFSLGLCNLVYALYVHYQDRTELQIKADLEE